MAIIAKPGYAVSPDGKGVYRTGNLDIAGGDPGATNPNKNQFIQNAASRYGGYSGPTSSYNGPGSLAANIGTGGYTPSGVQVDDLGNTIGSGPTTPPPKSAADTAFETYYQSLLPTTAEKTAQEDYNKLYTQSLLAREKALESGETLGFAAGEAQRVGRNFDIKLAGAGANVLAQQGLAQRRGEIGKARFDYEQGKIGANKPFELSPGQTRYAYNPETGKYEELASVPSTPAAKRQSITTVNGRRVIVDMDQNKIVKDLGASSDKKDEDPMVVSNLQDAQEAIDNGADPKAVRQRFLENHPNKGTLYNNYMGGEGVTF